MPAENPQLLSIAVAVREDGKVLFVQHTGGSFAGRWSPPLIGVAGAEAAEDALSRLFREVLHLQPGTFDFLDTLYLDGVAGERFIANAFNAQGWSGTPRFPAQIFQEAIWVLPEDAEQLDLLPEVAVWLATGTALASPESMVDYDAADLLEELTDARGDFIAAFDAIPGHMRGERLDEAGWTPVEVVALVADFEAYTLAEIERCRDIAGRSWVPFNERQWRDTQRIRDAEEEAAVRNRLERVRGETRSWLRWLTPELLEEYLNHPLHGVVQVGNRVDEIVSHDRSRTLQLTQMADIARLEAAGHALHDAELHEDGEAQS